MKFNKGFAPVLILLIVLGVVIVGGGAYYVGKSSKTVPQNTISNNYYPSANENSATNLPIQNTNTTVCNSNSPSTIKVLSPNGGEVYQAGQQITIKWESCNVTPGSIGLILIKHDPSTPYTQNEGQHDYAGFTLGGFNPYTGTADDGTEIVTLPTYTDTNLLPGQHYFISVSGLGDTTHIGSGYTPRDYSNELFTIN